MLFLSLPAALWGQEPCGYRGKSEWLTRYQQHRNQVVQSRGSDTAWLYVPMTLHIVGSTNSTYLDASQALKAVCEMNERFLPAKMRFFLMPDDPIRYHFNSEWNDHDWGGGADMINTNNLPGRMNAYLVNNPAGNCGYYWLDAIVLNRGCSNSGNTTWAHEAGHFFSLPHPFVGWEGFSWDYSKPAPETIDGTEVERVDRSNCQWASDGFCDTEPDYLTYRWGCTSDFRSGVLQKDPAGTEFRSDASLYMGYALDACASRFTAEQIDAMRANYLDERSEYALTEPVQQNLPDSFSVQLISPIDTTLVQYNDVTLEWKAVPGASIYTVELSFLSNFGALSFSKTVVNDTKVVVTRPLPNNRLMYWRVRAVSGWDLCASGQTVQRGVFKTQNLLATNDLERTLSSELSPNPASAGLPATLVLNTESSMEALLTLTDASGRQCYRQVLDIAPGENFLEIPTAALESGLYVVSLQNEKGVILKRLAVTE
ncbi:MAG TPA: T9SS type A sorting domain-containing protein [Saprospiraceae bacterium]|nr:T9SS type A sorting domain-containing protein [Saprospiraceae bacterium]